MEKSVEEKLNQFFSKFSSQKFKKGEQILEPEQKISQIFFIKKGLVRQYLISEEGEEITVNLFRPNSFFPVMLILSQTQNRHFFDATENVEALVAPAEKVVNFLKNEPEVLFDLTTRFAKAINGLSLRLEEVYTKNSYKRILSLLNYLAERFGEHTKKGIKINLNLTHQDIANWTEMSRETASRTLEKLAKQGLIKKEKHFYIVIPITDKKSNLG